MQNKIYVPTCVSRKFDSVSFKRSAQSRLATLLSSLMARRLVGLQTLLKDFSIDEMVVV